MDARVIVAMALDSRGGKNGGATSPVTNSVEIAYANMLHARLKGAACCFELCQHSAPSCSAGSQAFDLLEVKFGHDVSGLGKDPRHVCHQQ